MPSLFVHQCWVKFISFFFFFFNHISLSGDLDPRRTQDLGLRVKGRGVGGGKNGAYPGVIVTEKVGCDWLLIGAPVWAVCGVGLTSSQVYGPLLLPRTP